jgi:transcriptional regulator with XRE-family HTH domain
MEETEGLWENSGKTGKAMRRLPRYALEAELMIDDLDLAALGDRIDRAHRAKNMTIAEVAQKAGYDERTIRNAINGTRTKMRTLRNICEAVGIDLETKSTTTVKLSDESHGSYSSSAFADFYGYYISHRWSYDDTKNIMRTIFSISWSEEKSCAIFLENQTYKNDKGKIVDFSQGGELYSSDGTNLFHLMTVFRGRLRLVTLTKNDSQFLRGVVLTQSHKTFYQQPAISPIFMIKAAPTSNVESLASLIGEIAPDDPSYADLAQELRDIETGVVQSTFSQVTTRRHTRGPSPDGFALFQKPSIASLKPRGGS